MSNDQHLRQLLSHIDGRGYKDYKQIKGSYEFSDFNLYIDHVQGDPFALPSKVRLRVDQKRAQIPAGLWTNSVRQVALEDFIARAIRQSVQDLVSPKKGSGKSGLVFIDAGQQEVLERTAVIITEDWVETRLQVGLPAAGRRILGKQAIKILCQEIPQIVEQALMWKNLDHKQCRTFVECVENQETIYQQLDRLGLVAFVANGSVLPRDSGISDLPLSGSQVVDFQAPESLETSIEVPNHLPSGETIIKGMGIPKGITLIVGGGYHGKSTLLKALEKCVYAHIPGDGREYVITTRDAVKIRAEDGRRVEKVNINPFISNLPQEISTDSFCSEDASGSTSQAANIMEALEIGAKLLLLDEDTSATNFMVRDARMQLLVHKDQEPITPFVDRVRELYDSLGVSTVLVMGGSGDYFDVANTIIKMQDYCPYDVGNLARDIVDEHPTKRQVDALEPFGQVTARMPQAASFNASRGRKEVKIDARARDLLIYGSDSIDLRYVDQLVETSQTGAVGHAIYLANQSMMSCNATLQDVVERLELFFDQNGLDALDPFYRKENHPGNFSRPRKYEIAAAINRLRTLKLKIFFNK
tara:strand:+ start:1445 stop:3199 length:1755 start_codon:yes stop_codon:yes gene_type:complete